MEADGFSGQKNQQKNPGNGLFSLGKALAIGAHVSSFIFGPLVLFGGIGLLLDKSIGIYPWITLVALLIALAITNVLILTQTKPLIAKYLPTQTKKSDTEN